MYKFKQWHTKTVSENYCEALQHSRTQVICLYQYIIKVSKRMGGWLIAHGRFKGRILSGLKHASCKLLLSLGPYELSHTNMI